MTSTGCRAILTYRELGLGLGEIAAAVDSPDATGDVLRTARRRIDERIAKLKASPGASTPRSHKKERNRR